MDLQLTCMIYQDILKTRLQGKGSRKACEIKRIKRINEAMALESGTLENPRKHVITTLPNNIEVYFLKPGKEVANVKRPNPYDMTPVVGSPDIKLKFEDIWSYLSKISLINFDSFKVVLTLIYRNAYLIDHVEKEEGIIRYQPNDAITKCIYHINKEISNILPFGLMGLLHFLDLLGWNEDLKYHIENNRPTFSGKYSYNTGRINTLLTCIRVPYQASLFVNHCLKKAENRRDIDFSLLFTIMQQFAKSRGTCTPTQKQLRDWLSPYIF
jgi:hypothetical protein